MDATDNDPRICYCMNVDLSAIKGAIEAGARDVADLQDATGACTGCGTCRSDLLECLASARRDDRRPEAS